MMPIVDFRSKEQTLYYAAKKKQKIPNVGEFPRMIRRMFKNESRVDMVFKLGMVSTDLLFYVNVTESDDGANTLILNHSLDFVCANYFAGNKLVCILQDNDGILWLSRVVKERQKMDHIKPEAITPEVRRLLNKVDITQLSEKEQSIYYAFLQNGPVKYSKAQSLMAVLTNSNTEHELSEPLRAVLQIIDLTDFATINKIEAVTNNNLITKKIETMNANEFWQKLQTCIDLPFEIDEVVDIEGNCGSTWIEMTDGSTYYVIIEQCDGGEGDTESTED